MFDLEYFLPGSQGQQTERKTVRHCKICKATLAADDDKICKRCQRKYASKQQSPTQGLVDSTVQLAGAMMVMETAGFMFGQLAR